MPQMANMTVKKNDGVTDVVYTNVSASGGDKSPAVWRCNSVGAAAGQRPELRILSRANGNGTARRVEGSYTFPSLVTGSDGRVSVVDRFNLTFSGVVPLGMTDADVNEAAAQSLNLMAHTLVKQSFQSGFAPN